MEHQCWNHLDTMPHRRFNPNYTNTFVFTNDFAALLLEYSSTTHYSAETEQLRAEPETGLCKVICYSPRHDQTMDRMDRLQIAQVITTWQKEYHDLSSLENINHVQIFENHGLVMGCSNPHPQSQIRVNSTIQTIPAYEYRQQLVPEKQKLETIVLKTELIVHESS